MTVEIKNHLLYIDGKQVAFKKTPNISAYKNKLQYLIEHYTATYSASGPIAWLTSKESQVSAHLVIDKQGIVTQLAPFDAVCWHAGESSWKGLSGMNQYSIGIEIVNSGILHPRSNEYYSDDGHVVKDYVTLTNKLGFKATWEKYPPAQIETVAAVSQALKAHYNLKEIIGHEDVSPRRKTDPGPAFPWETILGAPAECNSKTTTADVNLRKEPSVSSTILSVIPKGTVVQVSKEENGWSFIGSGYISSRYLS
jgi:N-acetylmuramoyl-L-alanine amidase